MCLWKKRSLTLLHLDDVVKATLRWWSVLNSRSLSLHLLSLEEKFNESVESIEFLFFWNTAVLSLLKKISLCKSLTVFWKAFLRIVSKGIIHTIDINTNSILLRKSFDKALTNMYLIYHNRVKSNLSDLSKLTND